MKKKRALLWDMHEHSLSLSKFVECRGAPRFTGSSYGYNAGYGRSASSGGFGLGLGGGLLLGYTAGI